MNEKKRVFSIISMVIGILSFILGIMGLLIELPIILPIGIGFAIISIITGIIAMALKEKLAMPILGIVLSGIAIVIAIIGPIFKIIFSLTGSMIL